MDQHGKLEDDVTFGAVEALAEGGRFVLLEFVELTIPGGIPFVGVGVPSEGAGDFEELLGSIVQALACGLLGVGAVNVRNGVAIVVGVDENTATVETGGDDFVGKEGGHLVCGEAA